MPAARPATQVRPIRLGGATTSSTVQSARPVEPFRSAAEAWFWTMSVLEARREGMRASGNSAGTARPCDPDDVTNCLDRLYRQRRIDLLHVRIMRIWGLRRMAPNPAYPSERCDARIWNEAMSRLEWPLRVKGIVA